MQGRGSPVSDMRRIHSRPCRRDAPGRPTKSGPHAKKRGSGHGCIGRQGAQCSEIEKAGDGAAHVEGACRSHSLRGLRGHRPSGQCGADEHTARAQEVAGGTHVGQPGKTIGLHGRVEEVAERRRPKSTVGA